MSLNCFPWRNFAISGALMFSCLLFRQKLTICCLSSRSGDFIVTLFLNSKWLKFPSISSFSQVTTTTLLEFLSFNCLNELSII